MDEIDNNATLDTVEKVDALLTTRPTRDVKAGESINNVVDADWVSDSFMITSDKLDAPYKDVRFTTITDQKFTDSSLGGNICINPAPQYTRYSDVRSQGVKSGRSRVAAGLLNGNIGMGSYYGRAIDDNSSLVYMEFGVPSFNNILGTLTGAVDYKQAVVANSGRSTIFYNIGKLTGTAALFLAFPVVTAAILVSKFVFDVGLDLLAGPGRFNSYYLKKTMFTYWSTVNSIVTMMATELGILAPTFMKDSKQFDKSKMGVPLKLDNEDMLAMKRLLPGLITDQNGINVHAMVSKSQRMHSHVTIARQQAMMDLTNGDITNDVDGMPVLNIDQASIAAYDSNIDATLQESVSGAVGADKEFGKAGKKTDLSTLIAELKAAGDSSLENLFSLTDGQAMRAARKQDEPSYVKKMLDTSEAVFNEGARFMTFRVEHVGSVTDSFSNTVTNVGLGDRINSAADGWRSLKFDMGGGTIPGVDTIVAAALDVTAGSLDGVTLGLSNTVAGFLAGANINMEQRYDKSSVSLATHTFKQTLISPHGHPMSQLQALYIPLAALLAPILPRSTGPLSSTSPYLCSMFMRGVQKIDLGLMTSLSITRGTTSLPYTKGRRPLAIEVSFTITDLAPVMASPTPTDILSVSNTSMDDESGLSRYIQALAGRDLFTSTHVFDKSKLKISKLMQNADLLMAPETMGARAGDFMTNSTIFSMFSKKKAVNYSDSF